MIGIATSSRPLGLNRELEAVIADLDFVAVTQLGPSANRGAVDLCAVSAVQIIDIKRSIQIDDLRVLPTDRATVLDDLATGMSSQNCAIA